MNFEGLGLNQALVKGLSAQGIVEPTDVQVQSVPKILENRDTIIQSETGSGKTLAYLLPVFARHDPSLRALQVIVLVPTHELAMQVHHQAQALSKNSGIALKSMVIFGDVNVKTQIEKLREKPHIIIGTTGRILELIKKRKLSAHTVKTIVIDEADKMLDENNVETVKSIVKSALRDTQIVMLSASISEKAQKAACEIAKTPEVIKTSQKLNIPENIRHMYIVAEARDKLETLQKLLFILKPERAIAFINNAYDIEAAATRLKYHKLSVACLHGESGKESRKNILADFSAGKLSLLLATDLAARGLHVEGVEAILSLSIAENPLDYLHRSGRTGRGNTPGLSISIVTKRELPLINKYQNAFKITIPEVRMFKGKILEVKKGR